MRTLPEQISPSVEGYFRLPAIWVGYAPPDPAVRKLNPAIHHETVFFGTVSENLAVRVRRDGLFLFDFSKWSRAPTQRIPGYEVVEGQAVPSHVTAAEEKAEDYASVRAQLMNVHQACLSTAEYLVFHRSAAATGIPVDSASAIKSWNIHSDPGYHEDIENCRVFATNVMNNAYNIDRSQALQRRVLEISVIEKSFSLLNEILNVSEIDLIGSIDLLYVAAYRCWEKRFSESVVLSWTVCEKLINVAWSRYLKNREEKAGQVKRINNRRRQRLTNGRDFGASVISEILELSDILPFPLYEKLERSRRARNSWVHDLAHLTSREASFSIRTCEELLRNLFGVPVVLGLGYRGGVPSMAARMYEQLRELGQVT